MTGVIRRSKPLWLSTWPLWTFLVFEGLAAVLLLPVGYARAALAVPIMLMVPGSLTLAALFARQRRPQGTDFVCYAALLSVIWSGFASLVLYVCGVLITADSTYLCLLVASALLTIAAEVRFLREQQGRGRVARNTDPVDHAVSLVEADDGGRPATVRGTGYYGIVAAVAGVGLLAGGLYTYDHLPRPSPTGYTSMAWTGPQVTGDISIGSAGKELTFQIVHHQPYTTSFRLSATWLGNPSRPLANPLNLSIGSNQTFRGALFIPSPPDGCTYRIVVTLTAVRQIDPLTKRPQTWSINVDVNDPSKVQEGCRR